MARSLIDSLVGFRSINIVSGTRGHGDSVREDKLKLGTPFDAPTRVYLVYISINDKGSLIVHQLEDKIGASTVSETEDVLIKKVTDGNSTQSNFTTMIFKEPSYLTVVLDIDDWDFYYPDPLNKYPAATEYHDPIIFLEKKVVLVEDPANSGKWIRVEDPYVMNKSFFNSEYITKTVNQNPTGTKVRKAIRCINFLSTNDDGDKPGQGKTDKFGFNILVRVPYMSAPKQKVIMIIDPDGQNQGPPSPPPSRPIKSVKMRTKPNRR